MVEFFLRRPVTVCMLFLVCLVLGWLSYQRIPLQLLPSGFVLTRISVRIHCPGMSPEEVARQVAEPLEGAFLTIARVVQVKSICGFSRLGMEITFSEGTDMDFAYREVWDRIERVRRLLPSDIQRRDILVFKRSTDDIPIAAVAVGYPRDLQNLDRAVELRIRTPLARIPGVANVDVFGLSEYTIFVDLSYHRLKANRVGVLPLVREIQGSLLSQPSGTLYEGGKKVHLRLVSPFSSLEDLKQLQVLPKLPLEKVGQLRLAMPTPTFLSTVEGNPSILLLIYKESDANTVSVCDEVEKTVKNFQDPSLRPMLIFSQGALVKNALRDLESTALWGGVFALLVLFLFLWRFSLTSLVALAVPFSLLLTLTGMYFLGKSLNLLSLMGIMLAIGMVVDNSIVVVESIARKCEEGFSPFLAALCGTKQVFLAITAATATSVVVFLPFFLIESSFRFWLEEIGFPICLALFSSLVVAVVFVPLGASKLLRGKKERRRAPWMERAYGAVLSWILCHRFESSLLFSLFLMSVYIPFTRVPRTDQIRGHSGTLKIDLQFPGARSLEEVAIRVRRLEKRFIEKKEELDISLVRTFFSSQQGSVVLHQPSDRKPRISPSEFLKRVREILGDTPGIQAKLHGVSAGGAAPEIRLHIVGKRMEKLLQIAKYLEEELRELPAVLDTRLDVEENLEEIHVIPKREVLEKFGISPMQLAQTVRWTLNGAPLPRAVLQGREFPLHVALREEDRKSLSALKELELRSSLGKVLPLGLAARWEKKRSLNQIIRQDKKNQVTLTLVLSREELGKLRKKIEKKVKTVSLPAGYEITLGSRFRKFRELMQTGVFAIQMAVLLVFLLMGVLLESVFFPFCIMLTVPLAFLGVFWMLYLTNTPLEVMGMIGMVILVGIVVNNGIVLMERIQRRRQREEREVAVLESAKERLRPILMTALTTIFGMLPMALGDANLIGRPYYPLGRAVIGGLVASTFLTLFVVPLFYTLLDDLQNVLLKLWHSPFK